MYNAHLNKGPDCQLTFHGSLSAAPPPPQHPGPALQHNLCRIICWRQLRRPTWSDHLLHLLRTLSHFLFRISKFCSLERQPVVFVQGDLVVCWQEASGRHGGGCQDRGESDGERAGAGELRFIFTS